jgi:hypothetical protein
VINQVVADREEKLAVCRRGGRKRAIGTRAPILVPMAPNDPLVPMIAGPEGLPSSNRKGTRFKPGERYRASCIRDGPHLPQGV